MDIAGGADSPSNIPLSEARVVEMYLDLVRTNFGCCEDYRAWGSQKNSEDPSTILQMGADHEQQQLLVAVAYHLSSESSQ